jgi:hypothetical protein
MPTTKQTIELLQEKIEILSACVAPIFLRITASQVLSRDKTNLSRAIKLIETLPGVVEHSQQDCEIILKHQHSD